MHWDGKLLNDITGTEHVDRLPVILSQNNQFQLLGVPKMESGTGWNTAHAVYTMLNEWDVTQNVVAACYDTTAVNTGRLGGASRILQDIMETDLLELPCRHHIFELVLKSAFESIFGKSSAPIPLLFKRFKDIWNNINKNDFEVGLSNPSIEASLSDIVTEITIFCKNQLKNKNIRHDYEEFLQLCLTFIGDRSRSFPFRAPGAMSNARWMAKVLYSFKIYMFRSQFHLTSKEENALKDFLIFVIRFYVKAWFTCTNAIEAAYNCHF